MPGIEDHKTRLQEYAARHHEVLPVYEVRSEGPDHEKRFYAAVSIGATRLGRGEGRSKKEAEQAAAAAAWRAVSEVTDTRDAGVAGVDKAGNASAAGMGS